MTDSVASDAKRLLLRYGAPIAVVEQLSTDERIDYARSIVHTSLSKRSDKMKELLADGGYIDSD